MLALRSAPVKALVEIVVRVVGPKKPGLVCGAMGVAGGRPNGWRSRCPADVRRPRPGPRAGLMVVHPEDRLTCGDVLPRA